MKTKIKNKIVQQLVSKIQKELKKTQILHNNLKAIFDDLKAKNEQLYGEKLQLQNQILELKQEFNKLNQTSSPEVKQILQDSNIDYLTFSSAKKINIFDSSAEQVMFKKNKTAILDLIKPNKTKTENEQINRLIICIKNHIVPELQKLTLQKPCSGIKIVNIAAPVSFSVMPPPPPPLFTAPANINPLKKLTYIPPQIKYENNKIHIAENFIYILFNNFLHENNYLEISKDFDKFAKKLFFISESKFTILNNFVFSISNLYDIIFGNIDLEYIAKQKKIINFLPDTIFRFNKEKLTNFLIFFSVTIDLYKFLNYISLFFVKFMQKNNIAIDSIKHLIEINQEAILHYNVFYKYLGNITYLTDFAIKNNWTYKETQQAFTSYYNHSNENKKNILKNINSQKLQKYYRHVESKTFKIVKAKPSFPENNVRNIFNININEQQIAALDLIETFLLKDIDNLNENNLEITLENISQRLFNIARLTVDNKVKKHITSVGLAKLTLNLIEKI